tara:strand:+ start:49 stop:210 length:162 start_codon:yes stop_codon:yes gene_type:complete
MKIEGEEYVGLEFVGGVRDLEGGLSKQLVNEVEYVDDRALDVVGKPQGLAEIL